MGSCWEEHKGTCHSRGRRLGSQVYSRAYLELYLFFVFLVGKGKDWSHPGFFAVVGNHLSYQFFFLVEKHWCCLSPYWHLFFVFLVAKGTDCSHPSFFAVVGKNLSYPFLVLVGRHLGTICRCSEERKGTPRSRRTRLGSQVYSRALELYLFFVFLVGKGKDWSHPGFFAVVGNHLSYQFFFLVEKHWCCLSPYWHLFFVFLVAKGTDCSHPSFFAVVGKNLSYPFFVLVVRHLCTICRCSEERKGTPRSRRTRLGSQVYSRALELYLFFVFLVGKGKDWSHPGFFAVVGNHLSYQFFFLVEKHWCCLSPYWHLFFVFLVAKGTDCSHPSFFAVVGKNLSYPFFVLVVRHLGTICKF